MKITRTKLLAYSAAALIGCWSTSATAATIGIGDFQPGDTTIDFDGLNGDLDGGDDSPSDGEIVTNQFAGLGMTLSNTFGNSHADSL